MRRAWWLACAAAVVVAWGPSASANIAVPRQTWTPVRMVSEDVRIVLSPTRVEVVASFVLENEGEAITQVVGYPRGMLEKSLEDLTVSVDGEEVAVSSQPGWRGDRSHVSGRRGKVKTFPYQFEGPYPEWKVFTVAFAKSQRRTVVIRYHVSPGELKTPDEDELRGYIYVLRTAATWKGNVEKAVVEIELARLSTADLVSVTPEADIRRSERLAWVFKDFKPNEDVAVTFRPGR